MGIASRTLKQNGMAPFIPHFYALILDDSNKEERNLGMLAGLSMLWVCDAVWVFGDELTEGMKTLLRVYRTKGKKQTEIKGVAD